MREPIPAATCPRVPRSFFSLPFSMPVRGAAWSVNHAMNDPIDGATGGATGDELVLGFDFGTRRIGVAIGNTLTARARPLETVEARDPWPRIEALLAQWQPARLVTGIARFPDGAAHEMTRRCERFARQLEGRFRLPVERVDERYSSAVSEDGRDDEAAAVILQQWLDAGAGARPENER